MGGGSSSPICSAKDAIATMANSAAATARGGAAARRGGAAVDAASGGWGPLRFEIEAGANGLIARKREHTGGRTTTWDYTYDLRGRLAGVLRDGMAVEEYAYDRAGRRVLARTEATGGVAEGYAYDGDLLLRAGEESFSHADGGALAVCRGATGRTLFDYEPEGGLGRVELPDGRLVAYLTNDLGQPLEKFVDGRRTERFRWRDPLRLSAYRDLERGVSMRFHYGPERLPRTVTVIDAQGERTLHLGYDQVGTLKAVADAHGHLIQTMEYDSFGNPLRDSAPALFIPLGFGGGLRDRHTGLVRLVRRDYDPRVGRFTAPDPLGDTGGDHDLFEYCVDDPVNAVDPLGLKDTSYRALKKTTKIIKAADDILGPVGDAIDLKKGADALGRAVEEKQDIDREWSEGIKEGDVDKIWRARERAKDNMFKNIRSIYE